MNSMADEICGEPLRSGEGTCDSPAKHPDGKCGIHSSHSDFPNRPTEADNPLIQEFLERERRGKKTTTFGNRRAGCGAFDEWISITGKDPREVGPLSIEDFADWLVSPNGKGVSESTAQTYIHNVSEFYNWLQKRQKENGGDGDDENPVHESDFTDRLEAPNTSQRKRALASRDDYFALSREEMEKMIDNAQAPDRFRSQLIMKILAQTGCRPKELRNIRVRDVRDAENPELWENNRIRIRATKTERYNSEESGTRTVRYNDGLKWYLTRWLDYGNRDSYLKADESDYLFPSDRSEQINKSVVKKVVEDAAEAAGLQETLYKDAIGRERRKVTPYAFRHGFGTYMAGEGCPPSKLANLMGSDVDTVMKYYVQHREEELDETTELIPDV